MQIHERAIGPLGLYQNRPLDNLRLLWGRESHALHEYVTGINLFNQDVTTASTLLGIVKRFTPSPADAVLLMQRFENLYANLRQQLVIGEAVHGLTINRQYEANGLVSVQRRFLPSDLYRGKFLPLSRLPRLTSVLETVMESPQSAQWNVCVETPGTVPQAPRLGIIIETTFVAHPWLHTDIKNIAYGFLTDETETLEAPYLDALHPFVQPVNQLFTGLYGTVRTP